MLLIVIPCLNEAKHIEALTEQLIADNAGQNFQLVIADGGSTDGTVAIAQSLAQRHPQVQLMHNPRRIQSAAVNLAAATHGKDCTFLIRIDAHATYPAGYCAALLADAEAMNADSVVVSMDTRGITPFQQAVAAAQNSKLGNGGSAHRSMQSDGKWVDHGHHALMRMEAFRHVGGYDETFSHNEDAELDTRLLKAGKRIWLTAKTSLIYYPRASVLPLFRQYRGYGRGRIRNLIKHKTRPKLRQMLPVAVAPAWALALLAPWCFLMALPLLGWSLLCVLYGQKVGKATHTSGWQVAAAAMVMHTAWSLGFWQGLWQSLKAGRAA